jgi:deoxycytidylate deaminase
MDQHYDSCRQSAELSAGEDGGKASGQVFQDIMQTLQSNFVFEGICTAVLTQVVQRMKREQFKEGETIVQQGDQARPNDRLYYIEVCPCNACLRCRSTATSKSLQTFRLL